ncbi:hypothetical protein [Pelagovum pacificum]|uniref:Uncharacterized protein n=1 Tax=Pelagovum pacificum TaxID=2588711 RepID=A0A5C5GKL8_9RHOB|nr:hypothetical protein [Pelagovum pacificum]QQA42868.1 hypothetical protein I8N54_19190 [Pelagovum pacificum]TNY33986.1 hypothetical protein FHY64_12195 [Pelagovum pacificum]
MTNTKRTTLRGWMIKLATAGAMLLAGGAATAQTFNGNDYVNTGFNRVGGQSYAAGTYTVRNDPGGLLTNRVNEIHRLKQTGQPIRVTGRYCNSTCTMFIGLPNACIDPNTSFGFHGPSSYGRPLDPATFDSASRIMSVNYPPQLRQWFMSEGRHRINGMHRISGAQLINMGVRAC